MKRLAALIAVVPVLAACGASVDESAQDPTDRATAVLARAATTSGPGIRAADGSASFLVSGHELLRFDPATRKQTRSYDLGGAWKLEGVSANGRWVGLTRAGTEILVLDAETGTVVDELELSGNFVVETISVDGDFLFLQQNFVDGTLRGARLRPRAEPDAARLAREEGPRRSRCRAVPDRSLRRRTASGC